MDSTGVQLRRVSSRVLTPRYLACVMARPLRLEHEYALWHVTSRGNEKKDIFRDDVDRERFLRMLGETVTRFGWRLLAWVLMSNHFHLVIQTPEQNLSRGMHWLNGRYAQYFNRRHDRSGHLFQGRFHGALIEKESYFLSVARYVVLNPVRAGMVRHPADWRWSSYRQTAGLTAPDQWLAVEDLLENFGGANTQGCTEYVRFVTVATEVEQMPWRHLVGQMYLGRTEWLERMLERAVLKRRGSEYPMKESRPHVSDIVTAVARVFDITAEQLLTGARQTATARGTAAFLAFDDGLHTYTEIATALRVPNRATIGSMIRRCRKTMMASPDLQELVVECRRLVRRTPIAIHLLAIDQREYSERHPT